MGRRLTACIQLTRIDRAYKVFYDTLRSTTLNKKKASQRLFDSGELEIAVFDCYDHLISFVRVDSGFAELSGRDLNRCTNPSVDCNLAVLTVAASVLAVAV